MHITNSFILIFWLVMLALGCFASPYGFYNGVRWVGRGDNLCLFIAILMLKFVSF